MSSSPHPAPAHRLTLGAPWRSGGQILSRFTFRTLALYMLVGAVPVELVVLLALPSLRSAAPPDPGTASSDGDGGEGKARGGSTLRETLSRPAVQALLVMQCLRTCFWG